MRGGGTREVKFTVAPNPCRDIRLQLRDGNSLHETRSDQRHQAAGSHGARDDKGYTNPAMDPQFAMTRPRCPEEPRHHGGYVRDMDKYRREHKRLFSLDHFSPYGPWPTDFTEWTHFAKALYKSSNGTTSMDTIIDQGSVKRSIVIAPSNRWELSPKVGDMIVISRCHPALDRITAGPVTKVGRRSFHIEWATQWGPFSDFAAKVLPEDNRCPVGHFRADMEVESISTVRVDHALHELTTVRGAEEHNVSVITPLQAMLVYNNFTVDDIQNINDAEADRHRQERGFTLRRDSSDTRYYNRGASDASGASDAHGASDASGASDANGASDATGATDTWRSCRKPSSRLQRQTARRYAHRSGVEQQIEEAHAARRSGFRLG